MNHAALDHSVIFNKATAIKMRNLISEFDENSVLQKHRQISIPYSFRAGPLTRFRFFMRLMMDNQIQHKQETKQSKAFHRIWNTACKSYEMIQVKTTWLVKEPPIHNLETMFWNLLEQLRLVQ